MLPLTVLGIGLAFIGIGVAVTGALSTILIATGVGVTVVAGGIYLLRNEPSSAGGSPTTATTITDTGHGDLRGNVITGSTVNIGVEPPPASPPRRLLDATPQDLVAYFANHTDFQAHKLLEPYMGQWMQVTGRVRNVTARGSVVFEMSEPPQLFLWFDDPDYVNERVAILRKGHEVTIQGQVHVVDADTVTLNNCELVDA